MTKENYTNMSNQELLNEIKRFDINSKQLGNILRHQTPNLWNEIIKRTRFLDEQLTTTPIFIEIRLYALEHNMTQVPTCAKEKCTHTTFWSKRKHCFSKYCSHKCKYEDPNNKDVVEKENQKRIQTNEEKFGTAYPIQSLEIQEKQKQSFMKSLGTDNPMKNKQSKNKRETSCIEIYGGIGFGSKSIQEKIMQRTFDNFGVFNPMESDYFRQIIGDKIRSQEMQNQIKATNNRKFGKDWYAQTLEHQLTKRHKFTSPKYPGITFDSTWEIKVYDFLMENNIEFQYHDISIPYEYTEKTHYYFPDFIVNGRIYEVKGDQYFRLNSQTGLEEMYCPYHPKSWSDEYYEWRCGLEEAKHQCMIQHDAVILRHKDIKNLSKDLFL